MSALESLEFVDFFKLCVGCVVSLCGLPLLGEISLAAIAGEGGLALALPLLRENSLATMTGEGSELPSYQAESS